MSNSQVYYLANRDKRTQRVREKYWENPELPKEISRKYREIKKEIYIFEEELKKVNISAPQVVLDKDSDALLEISLDLAESYNNCNLVSSCNDIYKSKIKGVRSGDSISVCLDKDGIINKICIKKDAMFNNIEFK